MSIYIIKENHRDILFETVSKECISPLWKTGYFWVKVKPYSDSIDGYVIENLPDAERTLLILRGATVFKAKLYRAGETVNVPFFQIIG